VEEKRKMVQTDVEEKRKMGKISAKEKGTLFQRRRLICK